MTLRFENTPGGSVRALLMSVLLAALGALGGLVVAGGRGAVVGGLVCFVLSVLYLTAVQRYGPPANRNLVQAFFLALLFPTPVRILVAMGFAVGCVAALHVPMLNFLLVQVSWPLFEANPGFQKTGPDIEWWALGPKIRSAKAFLLFALYFMVVCSPLLLGLGYKALRRREQEPSQPNLQSSRIAEPDASAGGDRDSGSS